jgi:hypothetical protein
MTHVAYRAEQVLGDAQARLAAALAEDAISADELAQLRSTSEEGAQQPGK